ncbi:glycosyltransferase [Parahaliea sp. F7430]|uniref:Glycosyltransferase n=1 Tax=Sediminihaliea albiluteola TaxID=2758564 RepID=A0A7W2TUN1_9GAMM|nr:glycosyltransferase [Sediminihaliea albiluteola]MBA6412287.1 glycosyltransferase [Sediminihaliea albiluteola]
MKGYFNESYTTFKNKTAFVIPNAANARCLSSKFDPVYYEEIISLYKIDTEKPIVFFAGGYKDIGGVHDLIYVFSKLRKQITGIQLVLIGDGFNQVSVDTLVDELNIKESVIQLGRQPYEKLYTLQ